MNKRMRGLGIVVALLLVVLITVVAWAGAERRGLAATWGAGQHRLAVPLAAADMVPGVISYQGRLLDSSNQPVDGARTIDFRLYAHSTGGLPLWSLTRNVTADEGLFHVDLPIDPGHFDGRALWLGIQVQGDAQEMAPRQPLLPVPYALSLRPGAGISGTVAGAPTLNLVSDGIGLHAETSGSIDPRDPAVLGINLGAGPGVEGQSVDGLGVRGSSINGPGVVGFGEQVVGVHGESINGPGGFFSSTTNVGLLARSLDDAGIEGHGINAPAAVFTSSHETAVRIEGAGLHGLHILDAVWGDYIVAGGGADPDFRVSNAGDVYSDGAFHCGLPPGGEPGTCVIQNDPADLAEMLPARRGLEAGDVLVIGSDGRLARSTRAYESTVVGIYSTQPGYLGGGQHVGAEGYAPLAIVGIVPAKASGENGRIVPGDLLVASSTPGHAMKAGPRPPVGTVVGKALESLDGEAGVILMLVMLQ